MMDSNYFANLIASAPMQTSSRYFTVYLVEIDNCKIFSNRQRRLVQQLSVLSLIQQCRVPTNYTNLLGCVS